VPVTESGEVVGIVTKTDLLKSGRIKRLQMPVSAIMDDATVINRYHSVDHVIDTMSGRNDKLIVANNDGTIAGIITETNLAFYEPFGMRPGSEEKDVKFLRKEEPAGEKHNRYIVRATVIAEDVMTHPAITTPPETKVSEAVQVMRQHHINSIIVTEENEIKGILKRDAIIREVAK
jgi:CBS domain-containing protein